MGWDNKKVGLNDVNEATNSLLDIITPSKLDLTAIRGRLYDRLPERFQQSSDMLQVLDTLLADNGGSPLSDEELIYAFSDKFFMALEAMDARSVLSPEYALGCKFVSYQLMGYSNGQAYEYTFPRRASVVRTEHLGNEDEYHRGITLLGDAYAGRKMVTSIMEVSLVPSHIVNAPLMQRSINKLAWLMEKGTSERIQMESAVALMNKLDKQQVLQIEAKVDHNNDTASILDAFKKISAQVATDSVKAIESDESNITDVIAITNKSVKGRD